jgi:hypothetical protein
MHGEEQRDERATRRMVGQPPDDDGHEQHVDQMQREIRRVVGRRVEAANGVVEGKGEIDERRIHPQQRGGEVDLEMLKRQGANRRIVENVLWVIEEQKRVAEFPRVERHGQRQNGRNRPPKLTR